MLSNAQKCFLSMFPPDQTIFLKVNQDAYLQAGHQGDEQLIACHEAAQFQAAFDACVGSKGLIITVEQSHPDTPYSNFDGFHWVNYVRQVRKSNCPIILTSYMPYLPKPEKSSDYYELSSKLNFYLQDPHTQFVPLHELEQYESLTSLWEGAFDMSKWMGAAFDLSELYDPITYFGQRLQEIEGHCYTFMPDHEVRMELKIRNELKVVLETWKTIEKYFFNELTGIQVPSLPPLIQKPSPYALAHYRNQFLNAISREITLNQEPQIDVLLLDHEEDFGMHLKQKLLPFNIHLKGLDRVNLDVGAIDPMNFPFQLVIFSENASVGHQRSFDPQVSEKLTAYDIHQMLLTHRLKYAFFPKKQFEIVGFDRGTLRDNGHHNDWSYFQLARYIRSLTYKKRAVATVPSPFKNRMLKAYNKFRGQEGWEEKIAAKEALAEAFFDYLLSTKEKLNPIDPHITWEGNRNGELKEEHFFNKLLGRMIYFGLRNLIVFDPTFFGMKPGNVSKEHELLFEMIKGRHKPPGEVDSVTKASSIKAFFYAAFQFRRHPDFSYLHIESSDDASLEEKRWIKRFGQKWIADGHFRSLTQQ